MTVWPRSRSVRRRPASTSDDPEALESLRTLGYLGGSRTSGEAPSGLPDPKDRLALRDLLWSGEQALRAGRFDDALGRFAEVLRVDPENRFATLRSGMAHLKRGTTSAALPFLEKTVRLDPEQPEGRYALADAFTRLGREADAVLQWQETVRRQPRRVAAWSNLGLVLARQGSFEAAEKALEHAAQVEPTELQILKNLGGVRFARAVHAIESGRADEARAALGRALQSDPSLRARAQADSRLRPLLP